MTRIIIYTSDIIRLTGKSESYARKEIQNLRKVLGKQQFQKVTINEYCSYYGLNTEEVVKVLT
jgi:hypothetical protein